MKKIITIILLLISIISFGQNSEFKKAQKLVKDKMYTDANILFEKLLNKEFGELDEITQLSCLSINANCYFALNDFKTAYDKYTLLLKFIKSTKIEIPNKDEYVVGVIKFMGDLKSKIPQNGGATSDSKIVLNVNSTSKTETTETKVAETAAPASNDKTVTLTVSGNGTTLEEAKLNALRSAIEQAFGAFVSSKTEILNDNLIKDEIVSVTNGNIQKYDVVSQIEIPNNGYAMTLNATVSIEKLTSFAQSKGVIVEFKGGMFAQNIKLQKLNERAEEISVKNLCQASFEILLNSIDYNLISNQPSLIGKNGSQYHYDLKNGLFIKEYNPDDYQIEFKVDAKSNNNLLLFYENFKKTISALAMDDSEKLNYEKLNKQIIKIKIGENLYWLRTTNSAEVLNIFFMKANLIPAFFEMNCNIENYNYLLLNRNERKPYYNFLNNNWDYSKASNVIGSCENIYPFYEDLFVSYDNIMKENKSKIYSGIKNFRHSYFSFERLLDDNLNVTKTGNSFEIQPKDFSYTFTFNRFFTINDVEKIDKFEIKKMDLLNSLKKEQDRINNVKKIILYNMGYSGYVPENYILELNDKKYECKNYCDYEMISTTIGYSFDLIEKKSDFYIVKSLDPYTNSPGKLYKLKPSKEIIKEEY